ncbi:zinc ribbon-containing protein [Pseudoalteromonas ulvae]|uniref:Zinc ribbon-containing protein n=1 Tax=Pseudoalteromonas ulvae TaxID=107327 RepID=A0A244CV76_PSEDV|nr:hypothetical protein [Pseudoalteromonas ulvae]OUL59532.1 hypothetical protein B1199_04505 [Pseudoalteromonas ulvae]
MSHSNNYQKWLEELHQWLSDVKKHELSQLVAYIQKGENEAKAIGHYSSEQLAQYKEYFLRDLSHWQAHQKHYHQLALEELKESCWYELAEVADRSQVEWFSLLEDFQHNGIYHQGEWVGIGILTCKNCGQSIHNYHPVKIDACSKCQGIYFTRQALSP